MLPAFRLTPCDSSVTRCTLHTVRGAMPWCPAGGPCQNHVVIRAPLRPIVAQISASMKDTVHKIEEKLPGHHKVRYHGCSSHLLF